MPDISMCGNSSECPKKETCYRALAKPSSWQSYCNFYKGGESCKHYWEEKPKPKVDKNGSG